MPTSMFLQKRSEGQLSLAIAIVTLLTVASTRPLPAREHPVGRAGAAAEAEADADALGTGDEDAVVLAAEGGGVMTLVVTLVAALARGIVEALAGGRRAWPWS